MRCHSHLVGRFASSTFVRPGMLCSRSGAGCPRPWLPVAVQERSSERPWTERVRRGHGVVVVGYPSPHQCVCKPQHVGVSSFLDEARSMHRGSTALVRGENDGFSARETGHWLVPRCSFLAISGLCCNSRRVSLVPGGALRK